LAARYLSLEEAELAPLPTPQPAEAARSPLPVTGCLDATPTLVAHLNLDDANMTRAAAHQPRRGSPESWRVQNVGTCTWDSSYS
jgi:hypothetical protein